MQKIQSAPDRRWAKDVAPGDEIRALYLIGSASQLQAKNGPFWRIELKDASGDLEARIWSPLSQQFAEIPSGVIAEVEGRAESFRDKLQVNVNALRVLSPEETASVDTSAFMASSSRPPQEMLDELEALCRKEFTYKPWRKFILSVLEDEAIRVPLLTAPAAKSVHHAWVGGLLEHTLSVATLCLRFCDHYPDLDRQTLLAGAICHDLGKIWEFSGGLANDYTDAGRLVGHINPDSLEAYFQEAGRAGRDGEKAYAVILYTKTDRTTLHRRVVDTFPDKEYILNVYEHLQYYYQMAMGDGFQCVREFNLEEFCRKFKYFPVPVDSALKILTQAGYLEYTDEQDNASRILFTIRRDELYKLREMGTEAEALIQMILRSYTGVFTDYAYISEATLSVRTGLTREQIYNILVTLTKRRIVDYIPHKKTPYIIYTRERQELRFVHIPPAVYEERKARYEARIKAMEEYVISENVCRSRMLLRYFGEKNEHNCGQCDVCLSHRATDTLTGKSLEELKKKITELLAQKPHTPAEIAEKIEAEKERVSEVIQYLLEEGEWKMQDGMIHISK